MKHTIILTYRGWKISCYPLFPNTWMIRGMEQPDGVYSFNSLQKATKFLDSVVDKTLTTKELT